jgi:predicted RNA-binding protein with PIN domain
MRYLIDGYNLLHAMGLFGPAKGAPNALAAARLDLLSRLRALFGDDAGRVTVVFDAARVPRRGLPEHDYCGIHVRFAVRQEADDLIEAMVQSEPSPQSLTVVSDDHRIQVAVRRRRCGVLGCDEFLDVAERQSRPASANTPSPQGKPDAVSQEERQRWIDEFADLDSDPALRWLNPGVTEIDE